VVVNLFGSLEAVVQFHRFSSLKHEGYFSRIEPIAMHYEARANTVQIRPARSCGCGFPESKSPARLPCGTLLSFMPVTPTTIKRVLHKLGFVQAHPILWLRADDSVSNGMRRLETGALHRHTGASLGGSSTGYFPECSPIRRRSLQLAPSMEKIQHCVCLTFRISKRHVRKTDDREVILRKASHIGRSVCITTRIVEHGMAIA
jgi:hypothetical protein